MDIMTGISSKELNRTVFIEEQIRINHIDVMINTTSIRTQNN